MNEKLYEAVVAISQDVIGYFIPSETIKVLGKIILEKVNDTSSLFKDILIDAKRSMSDLSEEEKTVFNEECYLIYQYAIQGKAKHNLKLLISFLKNQINEDNALIIDPFYEYMDLLSRLTKDDITVIKLLSDNTYVNEKNGKTIDFHRGEILSEDKIEFYNSVQASLSSNGLLIPIPALEGILYKKTKKLENLLRYIKQEDL